MVSCHCPIYKSVAIVLSIIGLYGWLPFYMVGACRVTHQVVDGGGGERAAGAVVAGPARPRHRVEPRGLAVRPRGTRGAVGSGLVAGRREVASRGTPEGGGDAGPLGAVVSRRAGLGHHHRDACRHVRGGYCDASYGCDLGVSAVHPVEILLAATGFLRFVAVKGTRHKQNSLSGNTLFTYMPTYTRSQKKS